MVYALFSGIVAAFFTLASSGGSPGDYSGSPLSSGNCSNCHSGGSSGGSVNLSGMPSSYVLGQTYPLTLTINDNNMVAGGFMITAVNTAANSSIGSFSFAGGSGIRTQSDGLTHSNKKFAANGQVSWSFNWIAPNSGNGAVRFYFNGNAVNNDDDTGGDSPYAGSSNTITLPVTLTQWHATQTPNGDVLLSWQTAQELNNAGFEIERSQDGQVFEKIAFIAGKGTSQQKNDYQFIDKDPFFAGSPLNNIGNYRLRQIDHDGKETLTKIITVQLKGIKPKLVVYPNPVSDVINFESADPNAPYQIINLLGQTILSARVPSFGAERGRNKTQNIEVSTLPKGNYILRVGSEQVKFTKQ